MPEKTPPSFLRALADSVAEQRDRLASLLPPGGRRPTGEALHDVRVALRRAAALARLTRGVPARGDGEALRRAARDLRRSLSPQRSLEVAASRLRRRFARRPALVAAARRLAARLLQEAARPGGDADLPSASERLHAAMAERAASLTSLAAGAPDGAPERAEARLRRRAAKRLARARRELERTSPLDADVLHRFRIAAKELRYALEPAARADRRFRPLLALLREVQDVAGDAHDRAELVLLVERLGRTSHAAAKAVLPTLSRDAARALDAASSRAGRLVEALHAVDFDALREPVLR